MPSQGPSPEAKLRPAAAPALAGLRFRDPTIAQQNLALIEQRVPAEAAAAVPALLTDSPDPDTALNLFERLSENLRSDVASLLVRHRHLVHFALLVFGYSPFLGEVLIQNQDLLQGLLRESSLDRTHSLEEFRESFARFHSRSFESDRALLLARFKKREYVRILLRDVLGIATLAQTTSEISALSDVLIEEALREAETGLRQRYGTPRHADSSGRLVDSSFAVLSLGKLGGNELNYSSDVDLMFLYGEGEGSAGEISNREFFVRLAQETTELLSRVTREGAVFRIDLRLRPQGREGEPAVGLEQALRYYKESAHDWELQALIKARHSAGNLQLSRQFIRGVQPSVYTEEINFAAVETALETRDRIQLRRREAVGGLGSGLDVKLDRGGIRDIEFLVQCLQRVYGGKERWLRSGGTLFSLQKLHDKGHLSSKDFHALTTAYEFLRRVEHRLQVRRGQQTHRLPQAAEDMEILRRSAGSEEKRQARDLEEALEERMGAVAEIYARIVHQQQQHKKHEGPSADLTLEATSAQAESYRQMLARLEVDSPALYELARRPDLTHETRRGLAAFFSAAFTSGERYAAVSRAPRGVERALELFGASDFLTDLLLRHPDEVVTLERLSSNRAVEAQELFAAAGAQSAPDVIFDFIPALAAGYMEKLALLRQHYRHRVFQSGARDVLEARNVYESLANTSAAAEGAVAAAYAVSGAPPELAVLALGGLGSGEFDLLSDADLLFVREERMKADEAADAVEQMMHTLSAYTQEGTVLAVDARLRPHGAEGELVVTAAQLESYFGREAQAWEVLSYAKLRPVAGSRKAAQKALAAARTLTARFAGDPGFGDAIREMRSKLERMEGHEKSWKNAPGGLYDIDFLAGYLAVRHGVGLGSANLRQRLGILYEHQLLSGEEHEALRNAAEVLRTSEHVVRLVTGRTRPWLPAAEHARQSVEELAARIMGWPSGLALEEVLRRAIATTREIYDRLVR